MVVRLHLQGLSLGPDIKNIIPVGCFIMEKQQVHAMGGFSKILNCHILTLWKDSITVQEQLIGACNFAVFFWAGKVKKCQNIYRTLQLVSTSLVTPCKHSSACLICKASYHEAGADHKDAEGYKKSKTNIVHKSSLICYVFSDLHLKLHRGCLELFES